MKTEELVRDSKLLSDQIGKLISFGSDFGVVIRGLNDSRQAKQVLFSLRRRDNATAKITFSLDRDSSSILLSSHDLQAGVASLRVREYTKGTRDHVIFNFKRTSNDETSGRNGTRVSVFMDCEFQGSFSLPFLLFRDFARQEVSLVSALSL